MLVREEAGRFNQALFRLKNSEGAEWQSWRILDHQELIAIAERDHPVFPFRYMHLEWTYVRAEGGGTEMTWTQYFEIDPAFEVPQEVAVQRMDAHGRENQKRIKQIIEAGAVAAR